MPKKSAPITSREIGNRVKIRRSELGISQALAVALDVTYQQVQRYESGQNKLNVENIQVVADALSVPVSYFLESAMPPAASERRALYLSPDDSALLKYFHKIRDGKSKSLVVQLAKAAAAEDRKR